MKLAFISDVHGNYTALVHVIRDAEEAGADRLIGVGDWVGYGPQPNEVLSIVANRMTAIRGNYDRKVLEASKDPETFRRTMKPKKWKILEWTCRELTARSKAVIEELPEELELEPASGVRCRVVHGSPHGDEDGVYPSMTERSAGDLLPADAPDLLVCGHTHIPFVKRFQRVLVVNAGSAGQPVDGDPRAAYALVEVLRGKPPSGTIRRVEYPVERVIGLMEKTGLPRGLINDLKAGRKKREAP